jgi:hypothetical protein
MGLDLIAGPSPHRLFAGKAVLRSRRPPYGAAIRPLQTDTGA